MSLQNELFERVLIAYRAQINSGNFNGIKLEEVNDGFDDVAFREAIIGLVRTRKADVISERTQLNPHIKRLPPLSVEKQIELLDVGEKYHTCLYPTPEIIQEHYDLDFLSPKPFTKKLAEGVEQLKPMFFELGALDRYRLDPRYSFHFSEYAGRISMLSKSEKTRAIPERDQTFLQTFGLGVDEHKDAVVCVFVRYLSKLSPEHQRHWETFISHTPALMHENYYKPTILGEFWENNSAISAIRIAVSGINKIANAVWGAPLFLQEVPPEVHYNLSPFMRPTRSDYLSFAHELDKLVSENINPKFFDGKIDRISVVKHDDGSIERQNKGTLALLREWLFSGEINWGDDKAAEQEVFNPLRQVRRERQPAAHAVIQNEFDRQFTELKRKLLLDVAFALGNIFLMLRTHPNAPQTALPKWFEEGRIEAF